MTGWQVDVHIFDAFQDLLSEEWVRSVATLTLASEHPADAAARATLESVPSEERPMALGLVIADDETLHALNREYHGVDEVTDVLSFPFFYPGSPGAEGTLGQEENVPFIVPDSGDGLPLSLGEVIISYPQAARQAPAAGHTVPREVALLVAHGVLHLLGYDHATPEEEAVMWQRQDAVLDKLFPPEAS